MLFRNLCIGWTWCWVLLLVGCKSTERRVQWYPGPALTSNQVALIQLQGKTFGTWVHLDLINQEPLIRDPQIKRNITREIEVLPGTYDLSIRYHGRDGMRSVSNAVLRLEAAAGKVYEVRAATEALSFGKRFQKSLLGGSVRWMPWIEDLETGKVVAGKRREEPFRWYE